MILGLGAQWEAPDLHEKSHKTRHILLSLDGATREWFGCRCLALLWLREEYGSFEKVSHGGRVLRNASAVTADRDPLQMGIEHLTVSFSDRS